MSTGAFSAMLTTVAFEAVALAVVGALVKRQRSRISMPAKELLRRWAIEQSRLRSQVILEDTIKVDRIFHVGACDISFVKGDARRAVVAFVILSWPELAVVYETYECVEMDVPYVPYFLAFREAHHCIALIERARSEAPRFFPDVIFVDGNGILHPRGCGLACHIGVATNLPTIGVAKSFLRVANLDKRDIETRARAQGTTKLVNGQHVLGAAFCGKNVRKPIYISVGHLITLDTALLLTRIACRFRIPEPLRQADLLSRALVRSGDYVVKK